MASTSPGRASARVKQRSCSCRRGRSSHRGSGSSRFRILLATIESSPSTVVEQATPVDREVPRRTPLSSLQTTRLQSSTHSTSTVRSSSPCRAERCGALRSQPTIRSASLDSWRSVPPCRWPSRCPIALCTRSMNHLARTRVGRSTTSTTGKTTSRTSSSSSLPRCSPSRTRPSRSRTAWSGASRANHRCSPIPTKVSNPMAGRRFRRCAPGSPAPFWSSTETRTQSARTSQASPWLRPPAAGSSPLPEAATGRTHANPCSSIGSFTSSPTR